MTGTAPHTPHVPRDDKTVRYFDEFVPEYSEARLDHAARIIGGLCSPTSDLVDLGCGTGNTLRYLSDQTGITRLCGLDVSATSLEKARQQVDCDTLTASLLDPRVHEAIPQRFDFAILAAVLHHLIGRTRSESRRFAMQAVQTGVNLLRPGGHLFIVEPVYYPRLAMNALFYTKKFVSSVTPSRVSLMGEWNNIGAPVVSYYTNEDLLEFGLAAGAEIVAKEIEPEPLGRLNLVLNKTHTTLALRNPA